MRKHLIILITLCITAMANKTTACLIIANKSGIIDWDKKTVLRKQIAYASPEINFRNTNDKIRIIWQTKKYLEQATLSAIGTTNGEQNIVVANINKNHIYWSALINHYNFFWQTNSDLTSAIKTSMLKINNHLAQENSYIKTKIIIPYINHNLQKTKNILQIACAKSKWILSEAKHEYLIFDGLIHREGCFKSVGAKIYA